MLQSRSTSNGGPRLRILEKETQASFPPAFQAPPITYAAYPYLGPVYPSVVSDVVYFWYK